MKNAIHFLYSCLLIIFLQSCHSKVLTEVEVPLPEEFNSENPTGKKEAIKAIEGSFKLNKLNFPYDAFTPEIDAQTMQNHYEVVYLEYTNDLNKALKGNYWEGKSIEVILKNLDPNNEKLCRAACGYYNHNLFFESMLRSKKENGPKGEMLEIMNREFETFKLFKEEFIGAATTQFGSGFVWLIVNKDKKLQVVTTQSEDNPMTPHAKVKGEALFCLDLWEHSYRPSGKAVRTRYINKFFGNLDWNKIYQKYLTVLAEE